MLKCLNDILDVKHINKRIPNYYFPVALACDTPYEKILSRLLIYKKERRDNISDMAVDALDLADRYFLLEYINLLQYGIEPSTLKK